MTSPPGTAELRGIHAVLYALFDDSGTLHRAAMRQQVEFCIDAGIAGVVVLGLATEVAKLTLLERHELIRWAAEDVQFRVPLGVTIVGGSLGEQIDQVCAAERAGAAWVILQPPVVGSFAAAEYIAFYAAVAAATKLPVAVQNAPAYLGRALGTDDIAALAARVPNLALMKAEGPATEVRQLIEAVGDRLRVFNGRGGLELTDNLRAGCAGMILAPEMIDFAVTIERRFRAGDETGAEALYREILPAIVFIMQSLEAMICYGKRLFAARCGLAVHDRAPALRPTAFGLATVERLAYQLGPWLSGNRQ